MAWEAGAAGSCGWWGGSSISRGEGGEQLHQPAGKKPVGLNPKLEEGDLNPPLL